MSSSAGYSTRAGDCYVNGNLYASTILVPNAAGTGYQDITGNLRSVPTFVDTVTAGQVITGNKYFAAGVTQLDQVVLGSVLYCSAPAYRLVSYGGNVTFNNSFGGVTNSNIAVTLDAATTTVFTSSVTFTSANNQVALDAYTLAVNYDSFNPYTGITGNALLYQPNQNTVLTLSSGSAFANITYPSTLGNYGTLYQWNTVVNNNSALPTLRLPDPIKNLCGLSVMFIRAGGASSGLYGNSVLNQGNAVTISSVSNTNCFLTTNGNCIANVTLGYVNASLLWFKCGFVCIPNYDDLAGTKTTYCWNQFLYE